MSDFGAVQSHHWNSGEQVREYIQSQGIGSMLAFDGDRCVGQLYLQEYDHEFAEWRGWYGERPWADFQIAEPLGLQGRFLTLGCYHVGWELDGSKDQSLWGRGIGTALLRSTVEWLEGQTAIDGLLAWGVVPGSEGLLQWAGQMPRTVYERFGFSAFKQVRDARLDHDLAGIDTAGAEGDPALLRVMVLRRHTGGAG